MIDAADGPLDQVLCLEEQGLIRRAVENIPEAHREAFVLFYLQDQSVRQVADTLELSEVAVRKRLSRGRAQIKSELGRYVEDALGRLRPSRGFAAGVLALLPVGVPIAGGASTAATTSKVFGAGKYLVATGAWKTAATVVVATAAVAVVATSVVGAREAEEVSAAIAPALAASGAVPQSVASTGPVVANNLPASLMAWIHIWLLLPSGRPCRP